MSAALFAQALALGIAAAVALLAAAALADRLALRVWGTRA